MNQVQPKLVGDSDAHHFPETRKMGKKSVVVNVFEHWVFMFGKRPGRCALGPERTKAIERALALYGGPEMAMLAIEGASSCEWNAGHNPSGTVYDDVGLILRNEAQIERFAALGEKLREQAAEQEQQAAVGPATQAGPSEAEEAAGRAARERLRAYAAQVAGRQL